MSEIKKGKINSVKSIKIHTPRHCNSTLSGFNHAWMHACMCVGKFVCDCLCMIVWKECEEHTPTYHFHFLPSVRVVRLDWSHPGRPSGIMLGYEVLRRTLRSCAGGTTSSLGEESDGVGGLRLRCSYLQCPVGHGVCGPSCFHPDIQVIVFLWLFLYRLKNMTFLLVLFLHCYTVSSFHLNNWVSFINNLPRV